MNVCRFKDNTVYLEIFQLKIFIHFQTFFCLVYKIFEDSTMKNLREKYCYSNSYYTRFIIL